MVVRLNKLWVLVWLWLSGGVGLVLVEGLFWLCVGFVCWYRAYIYLLVFLSISKNIHSISTY